MAAATIIITKSSERDESLSRSTRYCSSSTGSRLSSSSGFASSRTTFSSPSPSGFASSRTTFSSPSSSGLITRSSSPVKVSSGSSQFSTAPVKLSVDPRRSVSSATKSVNQNPISVPKTSCMCSPSTHPGAFRCRLHKTTSTSRSHSQSLNTGSPTYARLFTRRLGMMNSIARLGGVEGEIARRALATLIRPTGTNNPPKSGDFKPRPSCLWKMSIASDN